MTKPFFHRCNVIDFGCADGVFLPSLSKYFNHVTAIEILPNHLQIAKKLVEQTKLNNVDPICNENLSTKQIKSKTQTKKYQLMYLLETIEHVGVKGQLTKSRINFLHDLFSLLEDNGTIILSMPKMVGLTFLLQRCGLALLNIDRKPISTKNLLKSGLFNNTDELEKNWESNGHLGFNHEKLEKALYNDFRVIKKKHLLFQVVYMIRKK